MTKTDRHHIVNLIVLILKLGLLSYREYNESYMRLQLSNYYNRLTR